MFRTSIVCYLLSIRIGSILTIIRTKQYNATTGQCGHYEVPLINRCLDHGARLIIVILSANCPISLLSLSLFASLSILHGLRKIEWVKSVCVCVRGRERINDYMFLEPCGGDRDSTGLEGYYKCIIIICEME